MAHVFRPQTLEKFEAACASIPLRALNRAFDEAGIRLGKDPGGPEGSRRAQFRRYAASVDQGNARQLQQLADALGALIGEVATSKQDYLASAAEGDGFVFANGTFRPAKAKTKPADLSRRLQKIAEDDPKRAIAGAKQLIASLRRSAPYEPATIELSLQALDEIVMSISKMRTASPRHARLAVDAAIAFATCVTEDRSGRGS